MVIGIIYGLYLELSIALSFILVVIILIANIKNKKVNKTIYKHKSMLIIILISIVFFAFYTNLLNNKYERFYNMVEEKFKIEATIISEARETEYYTVYNIKSNDKKFILYTTKQNLEYGMLVKIEGDFIEPDEARNYKGFDYKQYLKTKKIYGSIKSREIEIIKENNINVISKISNNFRRKIIKVANKILPEETQGLLIGLLIGDKVQIPENLKESFRNSSLFHILATSGTHISYIVLGITYILTKSKIPKKSSYFLIDLILIFFMFIVGFTPSIVRASIMGILLISSKIFYRKADIFTSMATSLIIILIYNPFCILDIGLQLSYLGTLGIALFNKQILSYSIKRIHIPQKIAEMLAVTISAQVLIIPVIALEFNTISLTFLLSNIIAVPLAGVIILLGYSSIFTGMFSLNIGKTIAIILNTLLKILINISKVFSKVPFSNILIPTPNIVCVSIYYLIVINFNKRKSLKIFIIVFIIFAIVNSTYINLFRNLEIHIIDVGQGDAQFIITPSNKKILIDGGEKENVLLEYLLDRQVMQIDYILISHFDSDHCYNLIEVLEKLKVKNLIIAKQSEETEIFNEIINICKKRKVNIILVDAGNEINISKDIKIKILWPNNNISKDDSINNNSIVAKLEYKRFSMLFTGDIEEKTESKLAEMYSENILNSTILKVAHHGSSSSSSKMILDKINSRIAVIGVGKNNKFGHPSQITIDNLKSLRLQNI